MDRTPIVVVAGLEDDGVRADVVFGRRTPGLSRRTVRAMALEGHLHCNGRRIDPSTRVRVSDRLELDGSPTGSTVPVEPLQVLAEFDDYVFINKPPRIHTHRVRPDEPPSLADQVCDRFPECRAAGRDVREGGALHRLDFPTTGVIAFARHPRAWLEGRTAISTHAQKLYVAALDEGASWPPFGLPTCSDPPPRVGYLSHVRVAASGHEVIAPLGPDSDRRRVRVRTDGRSATSAFWALSLPRSQPICLLVRLSEGRRHQIRAHLAHLGTPIRGDVRYGARSAPELLLHALQLDLGLDGLPVIEAPWPVHWNNVLVPTSVDHGADSAT